ncbi:MAG TPA: hypothetical protein VJB88_12905, partial [Vicinamibacteria bacterium]|nr:hypothetical protein [Vicinamibacteria bacterium]
DLLAYYLVTRVPSIDRIFINQPMTIGRKSVRERLKPDLVICKPSEVCALVDVKMDLGYQRDDFGPSLRKKNRLMTRLRGQKFRLLARKGNGRDPITLRLSPRAKYLSVVISDRNIAPAHFNEIEKSAASLGATALYVLTRDCHPNEYGFSKKQIMKKIEICHNAFRGIEREIRQAIA